MGAKVYILPFSSDLVKRSRKAFQAFLKVLSDTSQPHFVWLFVNRALKAVSFQPEKKAFSFFSSLKLSADRYPLTRA